ncbi:MexH family multidrug efflux RND transporter periplasmic adaptor subunit [Pseudomonas cichorii]|uniref:efflux RND transporter periplasmic adaptor subunit n=1 Tax=Pseudomonas cichorii TaxID=36746 RepID=UPI001910B7ED|nr:efflux RND transporter periplasmic adaptor subunit [Pseudomonas cichorii]GFM89701.1 MexH family multidrug efflux RND transporter periplasmic adaptor subunit [Pseudomonas cichorii]
MIDVGAAKRHPLILLLFSGLIILGGLWTFRTSTAQPVDTAAVKPVKVAVAQVDSAPFTDYLEAIGELEAFQEVSVPAEVGGRIVDLPIRSGQQVERGQVLVRLNDARQRADLVRLQGKMKNSQARLQRARQLTSLDAMSRQEEGDAQSEYLAAKGALQALEAEIDQLTIKAPFAGTLGIRQVHLGQYVTPGQTLINLVGNEGFYVNFSVPEHALPHIQPGRPLEVILDALPDQPITGMVTTLDPILDRSRMINVQARLQQPPETALPRMFARVKVPQAQTRDVLTVPETAITYNAYGEEIYVLESGPDAPQVPKVRRVAVKTGERRDGRVIIEQGVLRDDRVVVSGQLKLSDGAVIEPVGKSVLDTSASHRHDTFKGAEL